MSSQVRLLPVGADVSATPFPTCEHQFHVGGKCTAGGRAGSHCTLDGEPVQEQRSSLVAMREAGQAEPRKLRDGIEAGGVARATVSAQLPVRLCDSGPR